MDPVSDQLEAYNARDINRFVSYYDPEVAIEDGEGNTLMRGHDEMRTRYRALFEVSPHLHCRLVSRIRVGNYVIDEEEVTGVKLEDAPELLHAVAIYRIERDKIAHVVILT